MSFNPTTFNADSGHIPALLGDAGGKQARGLSGRVEAHELAVWLPALRSFFDLKNHPQTVQGANQQSPANLVHETEIVRQILRRCLHLWLLGSPEQQTVEAVSAGAGIYSSATVGELIDQSVGNSASVLHTTFSELYGVCCSLVSKGEVDPRAWFVLGDVLCRGIEGAETTSALRSQSPYRILALQQPLLLMSVERTVPDKLAGDISAILSLFVHSLEQLSFVEELLRNDQPLKLTLPLFTLVHEQARGAISLLEKLAQRVTESDTGLFDLLDGTGYAVGMELNKIFSRELVGLSSLRQPTTIYARVENSHGLLRDCFQQTVVALAQASDPTLDATKLFETHQSKLQQSLRLREALWSLAESVRRVEENRDSRPLAPLIAKLRRFQEGEMRHLMFKDWESMERFVAEVGVARGAAELGPVLHRFATYLDALFNQINMRAILSEHTFEYPAVND